MRHATNVFFSLGVAALLALPVRAQLPDVVSYQGYIEEAGEPVNDPAARLVFKIYQSAEGGTALWTEQHLDVPVVDGMFSVLLGSVTPTGFQALPFGGSLWLGINLGSGGELEPRTPLVAVPYSLNSLRLDGVLADGFLKKNVSQLSTANTANDLLRIENTGSGRGMTVISTGGHGMYGKSSSGLAGVEGEGAGTGPGLRGSSSANHGTIGYTEAADKAGVFGNSPSRIGVWGNSVSGTGVYGLSTSGFGINGESGENHGVRGLTRSTNEWVPAIYGRNEGAGDGVYGWSQFRHGVYGVTTSSEVGDAGVFAVNNGGGAAFISDGDAVVNGDLWVEGELQGNVGANNAPPFPRPAFDSGWIDATSDAIVPLGVGLYLPPATYDRDNFVVDLTYMHNTTIEPKHEYQANNTFNPWPNRGLKWSLEDNNDITVYVHNNSGHIHKIRLRVWYYR